MCEVSWALKFVSQRANSQRDGICRWGLWEVIRFRRGHESGDPHDGISTLTKTRREPNPLSLSHVKTWREGSHLQARKRSLTRPRICEHLHWDAPASKCEKSRSVVEITQSVEFVIIAWTRPETFLNWQLQVSPPSQILFSREKCYMVFTAFIIICTYTDYILEWWFFQSFLPLYLFGCIYNLQMT